MLAIAKSMHLLGYGAEQLLDAFSIISTRRDRGTDDCVREGDYSTIHSKLLAGAPDDIADPSCGVCLY